MLKKNTVLLLFVLLFFQSYCQQESFWSEYIKADIERLNLEKFKDGDYEKVYRIWTTYQVIELVKRNESTYSGKLVNYITKTHRKKERNQLVKTELKIPSNIVRKLMDNLSEANIETLPDGESIDGYVSGFDGTTYVFEVKLKNIERVYSYWEPMSKHYQNDSIRAVRNIRTIIANLTTEIKPDLHFKCFTNALDCGNYCYGGVNMVKIKK